MADISEVSASWAEGRQIITDAPVEAMSDGLGQMDTISLTDVLGKASALQQLYLRKVDGLTRISSSVGLASEGAAGVLSEMTEGAGNQNALNAVTANQTMGSSSETVIGSLGEGKTRIEEIGVAIGTALRLLSEFEDIVGGATEAADSALMAKGFAISSGDAYVRDIGAS
ncbi:MAG TPA: hypothetical protein VLH86_06580 [Patescibacteria group bacterium]|nr:hypothetical protein [Patescibacteria group bacterium]